MHSLDEIRKKIDEIDDDMLELFEQRLQLSKEVAEIKRCENLPVLSMVREQEIICRLTEGKDCETAGYIEKMFTTLFEISKECQKNRLL